MAYNGKKQGVISGSVMWNNKEYVEIFDQNFKYLWGEVDDLFIAYGSWVEYDVVDSPPGHPKNCYKRAININMDVKKSNAPTTDEFGKKMMNVRDFNKVDYFQFDAQGEGILTHKTTIRRNFNNDTYYNKYYGEVTLSRDSRNRLIQFNINEVDVMLTFIPSTKYSGSGPHWEVTHFINLGKMYSLNGYLSIRGFVLRGAGGVVRNRCDVQIPPDALRPKDAFRRPVSPSWDEPLKEQPQINTVEMMFETKPRTYEEYGRKKFLESQQTTPKSAGLGSRGLGSLGSGTFGAPTEQKMTPIRQSFDESKPLVKPGKSPEVVAPRQLGFGVTTGTFGAKDNSSTGHPTKFGFSHGSFGGQRSAATVDSWSSRPAWPSEDDIECPVIDESTRRGGSTSTPPTPMRDTFDTPPKNDPFEDDWGDSIPSRPRLPQPKPFKRSGLPPQVKTGLSKYSNDRF